MTYPTRVNLDLFEEMLVELTARRSAGGKIETKMIYAGRPENVMDRDEMQRLVESGGGSALQHIRKDSAYGLNNVMLYQLNGVVIQYNTRSSFQTIAGASATQAVQISLSSLSSDALGEVEKLILVNKKSSK